MKKVLGALAGLSLLASGCGAGDRADDFRGGVPKSGQVELKVPGGSSSQGGLKRDELQGQKAQFYVFTRGITLGVNAGTGFVLNLVEKIAEHQPTTINGNVAVWGPHTEALSPNTYKFTAEKTGDVDFSYKLEAKAKDAADTAYVTVLSGTHTKAVDANGVEQEDFGNGQFTLDWNAAATLPEHGKEVGKATITYSRLSATADTTIDVAFVQVKDEETGKLIDANYKYKEVADGSGSFQFSVEKDVYKVTSALETMSIKSRWQTTGAGRSDVKASGGDIPTAVTANECWDSSFNSQFSVAGWAPLEASLNYGQESTCVFATAEYAQ